MSVCFYQVLVAVVLLLTTFSWGHFYEAYEYCQNKHFRPLITHATLFYSVRLSSLNFVSLFCVALTCIQSRSYISLTISWVIHELNYFFLKFLFGRIYHICQYMQIFTIPMIYHHHHRRRRRCRRRHFANF